LTTSDRMRRVLTALLRLDIAARPQRPVDQSIVASVRFTV
jgi:hypothetical protein